MQYGIGPPLNLMKCCSVFSSSNSRLSFVLYVKIISFFCWCTVSLKFHKYKPKVRYIDERKLDLDTQNIDRSDEKIPNFKSKILTKTGFFDITCFL